MLAIILRYELSTTKTGIFFHEFSEHFLPNVFGTYRMFIKYCGFFSRILESLPPLPRQHSSSIGCKKNYQPIGLTVHSHCVESFEGLLQRCRRGRDRSEL